MDRLFAETLALVRPSRHCVPRSGVSGRPPGYDFIITVFLAGNILRRSSRDLHRLVCK